MKNAYTPLFPAHLLDAATKNRVQYFRNCVIEHANQQECFTRAISAINSACSPMIIQVVGPTGAGKSTLAIHLYQALLEQYVDLIENDPGAVPIAILDAIAPNGSSFNWKDFYIRLLEKHGDILTDRKTLLPRQYDLFEGCAVPIHQERTTTEALRRTTEKCLKNRKTKVLIIDEAHHLLMVNNPKRLEFQFEALKSLTIESNVVIVLVGTYKLLAIRDQSGQLVRRSEVAHFPRYNLRQKEDQRNFLNALVELQRQLPLPVMPNLSADVRYYFLKSGGSIGILKDWLSRCLEHAILRGMQTFDHIFAEKFALSNKALITILDEAIEGEIALEDASIDEVKELLYRVANRSKLVSLNEPAAKRAGKVGERRPVRDKTGNSHGRK